MQPGVVTGDGKRDGVVLPSMGMRGTGLCVTLLSKWWETTNVPLELLPVFTEIVEKCSRLCGHSQGGRWRRVLGQLARAAGNGAQVFGEPFPLIERVWRVVQ